MDDIINQIIRQLLGAIDDSYDKTEGYLVYDILKSAAIALADLQVKQNETKAQLDVNNLTGEMLEKFVFQRKGIKRNQASFAIGDLKVTGNGTVTKGDLFETKSGIQFAAVETKMISSTGTVGVKCVTLGSIGNVPANQITMMPVTIPSITNVTNPAPTHDGYDAESDDSLRDRYFIAIQTPATSGNIYHYLQWAKEITGVGDAKVFPLARGDNTVEVVIIDQSKQPASETLVGQVQTHIDPNSEGLGNGEAPIGAKCYVISAAGLQIDLSLNVQAAEGYTNDEIIMNIKAAVSTYLQQIAFQMDYVSYAKIGEAILNSKGIEDYSNLKVNGGTTNVEIDSKQVAVVGGVTLV